MPPGTDKIVINKCSDFFMQHKQYDKAVNLYIIGGDITKALELCEQHKVKITEEMAEKMTPGTFNIY